MMSRRGQGALEYLLILAAILAIAVVAILVAHNIMSPARTSVGVGADKYSCSISGIELLNYNKPYDGTQNTAPGQVKPCGTCSPLDLSDSSSSNPPSSDQCMKYNSCKLQKKYDLVTCFKDGKWSAYLQSSNGYLVYGAPVSGGGGGVVYASDYKPVFGYSTDKCGSAEGNEAPLYTGYDYWANFTFEISNSGRYQVYVYNVSAGSPLVYINGKGNPIVLTCNNNVCTNSSEYVDVSGPTTVSLNMTSNSYVYVCGGDTQKGPLPNDNYTHPPYLEKV